MAWLRAVVGLRTVSIVGAAAAASCAQLAGIENTTRAGDTVTVVRMSVGATVTTAPQDLTGLQATYFVPGADPGSVARMPAMTGRGAASGVWTSPLHAPAPVEFTLPDAPAPVPRLYAFPSPQLSVLFAALEHPDPAPAPDGATFSVAVPLDTAPAMGEVFQSYVVGPWLVRNFAPPELVVTDLMLTPPPFSFTAANVVSGRPQIDRVTPADAFLVLRYVGSALTGVAEGMPVDQTGAATTVTTSPMTAVAADQTLGLAIAPAALAARYAKVQPAVATLQMNWSLVAAPGYRIASNTGPVLQSGAIAATDTGVAVKYGNPFAARGWNTIFTVATFESRSYLLPGAMTGLDLFAGMNQLLEPSPGFDLQLPAGLPIVISLDDVPLVSDGQLVAQPRKFASVSFLVSPAPGVPGPSATVYSVFVYDLTVNPTTMAPERRLTYTAVSDQPRIAVPPELFQVGHYYTLRAFVTLGGLPGVASGNFVDRELPQAQSYFDSAVIQVTGAPP